MSTDRKKAEERIAALEAETLKEREARIEMERRTREAEIERELVSAANAAGAYKPDQVARLLRGSVMHDESGRLIAVDAQGRPLTDGNGGDLDARALVGQWLGENEHFKRAATGRGANSSPSGGGAAVGLDLNRVKAGDIPYIRKHKQAIYEAREKGQLK